MQGMLWLSQILGDYTAVKKSSWLYDVICGDYDVILCGVLFIIVDCNQLEAQYNHIDS